MMTEILICVHCGAVLPGGRAREYRRYLSDPVNGWDMDYYCSNSCWMIRTGELADLLAQISDLVRASSRGLSHVIGARG